MESKKLTLGLLIFYLIVLTWIIVFKLSFSFSDLPDLRSINLIPFGESVITNGKLNFSEILNNIIAFIPFGILINVLWENKTFIKKTIPIILTSLLFEVLQFIFGIGASDITDIISNSLGGIIGILIAVCISKILKNNCKKIINAVSLIGGTILILFVAILVLANI